MKMIFKDEWRKLNRYYAYIDGFGLVLIALAFLLSAWITDENSILGLLLLQVGYLVILGTSFIFPVRFYRTRVGRQAVFYHQLPVSKAALFWGQVLAHLVQSFIALALYLIALIRLLYRISEVTFSIIGSPNDPWPGDLSPALTLWEKLGAVALVAVVFMAIILLGELQWAAILQTLADRKLSRLSYGAPILMFFAQMLIVILGFALWFQWADPLLTTGVVKWKQIALACTLFLPAVILGIWNVWYVLSSQKRRLVV